MCGGPIAWLRRNTTLTFGLNATSVVALLILECCLFLTSFKNKIILVVIESIFLFVSLVLEILIESGCFGKKNLKVLFGFETVVSILLIFGNFYISFTEDIGSFDIITGVCVLLAAYNLARSLINIKEKTPSLIKTETGAELDQPTN